MTSLVGDTVYVLDHFLHVVRNCYCDDNDRDLLETMTIIEFTIRHRIDSLYKLVPADTLAEAEDTQCWLALNDFNIMPQMVMKHVTVLAEALAQAAEIDAKPNGLVCKCGNLLIGDRCVLKKGLIRCHDACETSDDDRTEVLTRTILPTDNEDRVQVVDRTIAVIAWILGLQCTDRDLRRGYDRGYVDDPFLVWDGFKAWKQKYNLDVQTRATIVEGANYLHVWPGVITSQGPNNLPRMDWSTWSKEKWRHHNALVSPPEDWLDIVDWVENNAKEACAHSMFRAHYISQVEELNKARGGTEFEIVQGMVTKPMKMASMPETPPYLAAYLSKPLQKGTLRREPGSTLNSRSTTRSASGTLDEDAGSTVTMVLEALSEPERPRLAAPEDDYQSNIDEFKWDYDGGLRLVVTASLLPRLDWPVMEFQRDISQNARVYYHRAMRLELVRRKLAHLLHASVKFTLCEVRARFEVFDAMMAWIGAVIDPDLLAPRRNSQEQVITPDKVHRDGENINFDFKKLKDTSVKPTPPDVRSAIQLMVNVAADIASMRGILLRWLERGSMASRNIARPDLQENFRPQKVFRMDRALGRDAHNSKYMFEVEENDTEST